jgi:hypothetical protein
VEKEGLDGEKGTLSVLREKAAELAGRPIEVEELADGKFIVMFMNFDQNPPPKGDTELEALKNFIEYRLPQAPVEASLKSEKTFLEEQNGSKTEPATQGSEDDSSPERT